jgi:very-short-patch-repair endonuclease
MQERLERPTRRARELRNNATDAERKLWLHLSRRQLGGHKFSRQMPVGPFVCDFLCRERGLVVEVDGGQHAKSVADARRTAYLRSRGLIVIRFWNNDVLGNTDGVLAIILAQLEGLPSWDQSSPPPTPPASGRGVLMTLSPAFLDELRARITLSTIIAPHVKLTRAGREYKACCPFHSEKTPSFTVNDEKHFYHCFGCGAHGDAIRFLTDSRGLPFMDAVKELAASAGMEVPAPDPRSRERAERQATLHDVMAAAQAWFAEQLDGIEGAEARAYCQRRGIGTAAIKRFGIGFAPDRRQGLRKALATHGDEKLIEGGLLIHVEEKEPYDRFRGRLMIPIRDARGRVIGFGRPHPGPGRAQVSQ